MTELEEALSLLLEIEDHLSVRKKIDYWSPRLKVGNCGGDGMGGSCKPECKGHDLQRRIATFNKKHGQ